MDNDLFETAARRFGDRLKHHEDVLIECVVGVEGVHVKVIDRDPTGLSLGDLMSRPEHVWEQHYRGWSGEDKVSLRDAARALARARLEDGDELKLVSRLDRGTMVVGVRRGVIRCAQEVNLVGSRLAVCDAWEMTVDAIVRGLSGRTGRNAGVSSNLTTKSAGYRGQ